MAKINSFDTKTLADSGREFELSDLRTGLGADAFITVQGTDSDTYRELVQARQKELMEKAAAGIKDETPAHVNAAKLLAALTKGWRNLEESDGTTIVFSQERAEQLYLQHPPIAEQVDSFISRRTNFLLA